MVNITLRLLSRPNIDKLVRVCGRASKACGGHAAGMGRASGDGRRVVVEATIDDEVADGSKPKDAASAILNEPVPSGPPARLAFSWLNVDVRLEIDLAA